MTTEGHILQMTDYLALLERLKDFIAQDTQNKHAQLRKKWALPLGERVARGYALEGISIQNLKADGQIGLHCYRNESRFREGDFMVLHRGDPAGEEAVQIALEFDAETSLEARLLDGKFFLLEMYTEGWIADESMLDLSGFFRDTLDEVADTVRGRDLILPLISGLQAPNIDYAMYERAWESCIAAGLNESQAEAAAMAYASDLAYLIQGPPGTGKTFVLAHLARLLVADGQRVLVTALTHRAINNALNKIQMVDPAIPVCKVGMSNRALDLEVTNFENFAESGFYELNGGYVVGATPFATRTPRLSNIDFDVILFDEASQVTLPLAIMGMLAGAKFIFIGDEKQLPPVTSLAASEGNTESIFSYLSGRGYETMLTTTYRLNDTLAKWPSRTFYEGKIVPDPTVAKRRLKLDPVDGRWKDTLDPQRPAVFLDVHHQGSTIRCRREAEITCDIIQTLLQARVPAYDIGVVVPYRAQARLIRNLLRRIHPNPDIYREIIVDTVERMQGQEREVVLISLTTSNPKFAEDLADFYFQPERLNVAITRPRTKLIILGSRYVLEAEPEDEITLGWVDLMKDLLSNCHTITMDGWSPGIWRI